jgi:hypothetical protein
MFAWTLADAGLRHTDADGEDALGMRLTLS